MAHAKTVWKGAFLSVERHEAELPGGKRSTLEILRHPGAALVLPVTEDGRVLLLRQYRHATGGWLLEAPAGKLDPGESPESCAVRETEEETGMRPGRLESLGWIWTTPGFTDEKIWLFAGFDLTPGRVAVQEDEVLEPRPMPLADAIGAARNGTIVDAKTVCALLRLEAVPGVPC